jgi:hypothetical protein
MWSVREERRTESGHRDRGNEVRVSKDSQLAAYDTAYLLYLSVRGQFRNPIVHSTSVSQYEIRDNVKGNNQDN